MIDRIFYSSGPKVVPLNKSAQDFIGWKKKELIEFVSKIKNFAYFCP
jgi:hypothetical protein